MANHVLSKLSEAVQDDEMVLGIFIVNLRIISKNTIPILFIQRS